MLNCYQLLTILKYDKHAVSNDIRSYSCIDLDMQLMCVLILRRLLTVVYGIVYIDR